MEAGVQELRTKEPGDPSWVQVAELEGQAAGLSFPSAIMLQLCELEKPT